MSSKEIVLISFLSSLAIATSAQQSRNILKRFELVGGPTRSFNYGITPHESRPGYSAGLGYDQYLAKSFSINLRTLYEFTESISSFDFIDKNPDGSSVPIKMRYISRFKYLTIYLAPTFHFGRNKNIHVALGGYYSFTTGLSAAVIRTRMDTGVSVVVSATNSRKYFDPPYDAGIIARAGYTFNLGEKLRLMLEAFGNEGGFSPYSRQFGWQRHNNLGLLASLRTR